MDEPLGKDFSYLCPLSVLFSCSRSLPSAREGRGRGRALPLSVVLQSLRTHQNSNFWPHFPPPAPTPGRNLFQEFNPCFPISRISQGEPKGGGASFLLPSCYTDLKSHPTFPLRNFKLLPASHSRMELFPENRGWRLRCHPPRLKGFFTRGLNKPIQILTIPDILGLFSQTKPTWNS